MCPKCKSREREKPTEFGLMLVPSGAVHEEAFNLAFGMTGLHVAYYDLGIASWQILNYLHSFFCSDCGYELGRYG